MHRPPGMVVAVPLLVVLTSGLAAQAQLCVTWSRNRDRTMNPRQAGEPVNALPKAF